MDRNTLDYFLAELSHLLNAPISDDVLRNVIEQESSDRLNNAITRAKKGEKGAVQFLKNCFPVEDARGRRNAAQQQSQGDGTYPVYDDDSFPVERMNGGNNQPGQQSSPPQEQQTPETTEKVYFGQHVYGGKGALYFQANFKEKHGLYTIAVDGAPSAGIRKYDWNKKIRLQLTQEELPRFFAVFSGMSQFCKLSNHGPGNNKALEIHDQGNSLFVQMYAPKQNIAVKILPSDAFYISQIIMRQMLLNAPWMDSTGVLNLVRMVVANRMENHPSQQQNKRQR